VNNKNMTDYNVTTIVDNVAVIMEFEGFNVTNEIRLKCYDIAMGKINVDSLVNKILENYNDKSKI